MALRGKGVRTILLGATALAGATWLPVGPAAAQQLQEFTFDLPAQPLGSALRLYARAAHEQVIFADLDVRGRTAPAIVGTYSADDALNLLLAGTGLDAKRTSSGVLQIAAAADPQSGSAAGDGADGTVAALIVTAQRREEQIQDVPIAISAFTEKSLQEQKIEGGFDLLKAIPNVTFSKNNFTSYNFSIRGIGTKAISVTTDPGVAVEFNSTALIRNRLFEQEYFDIERVEVLRGPQGTLHGRNATAGVINVISAKPTDHYEAQLKGEVGNYNTRRVSGMLNIPVGDGDKLAFRLAGAWTKRDGYDFNATTNHAINGRDLYSTRVTIGLKPIEALRANFIWEHFNEDDDRSRTGKQLCYRDPGPTVLTDPVAGSRDFSDDPLRQGYLSQGCKPGSLYDKAAFGTPNGLSIPFVQFAADQSAGVIGYDQNSDLLSPVKRFADPYGGMMQSPDMRTINSIRDPKYRAKTDVLELNVDYDLSPKLTLSSQTAYVRDQIYSFQDYNRFNTVPVFSDTLTLSAGFGMDIDESRKYAPGGVFCDPQIGCSNSLAGFDISQAHSSQFSQEFRLQSSFDGPVNFSMGTNYTHYKTLEDYYVFINLITYVAQLPNFSFNASPDPSKCRPRTNIDSTSGPTTLSEPPAPIGSPNTAGCVYIDTNPIEKIDGQGHNYFRSKNPYRLSSWAGFGEVYWQVLSNLKLTLGLRYTDDRKTFTPVPTQVLLSRTLLFGGTVDKGYPASPDIKQHWGEVSGRFGVDWKPQLSFTDQTMLYAFYSRGYKAGGANPPGIGYSTEPVVMNGVTYSPVIVPISYPKLFEPEFVNAFEVGAKNTLAGGALILNGDVFFYDYKDYQISQIKERTAVNENFDAKVWGVELEMLFQPAPNTRFNGTFGYQDSAIANGEQSLDLMDRLQGHDDYVVVRPFVQLASSCVVPKAAIIRDNVSLLSCGGALLIPRNYYGAPNDGQGFYADLGGNELPNAPHWTTSFGAQQSWAATDNWRVTLRADAYWQSQSWARVYNAVNDKLHGWYNANLSLWAENPQLGLKIEVYAKNLLDKTPITDAFLNSDDSALTTNIFVLDPRLIGFSVKKDF